MTRQRLTPPPGAEGFSDECLASREEVLTACVQQLSFPAARSEYDEAVLAGQTTVPVPLDKLGGALALLQARVTARLRCKPREAAAAPSAQDPANASFFRAPLAGPPRTGQGRDDA